MDEKNLVDVSSFMLYEATGDSEADSHHEFNMASMDGRYGPYGMDVEPDYSNDDDAESCINDLLESNPVYDGDRNHAVDDEKKRVVHQDWANLDDDYDDDDGGNNSHDDDHDPHHVDDGYGDGDEDVDEDEVVMKSTAKTRPHKKRRVCVDSTMGLLNEMEKNRLFWEACLAS